MSLFGKLFGFNKNTTLAPSDALSTEANNAFSFLGTDMHSHLLPGIDDGAQTIEDSLTLIRGLIALGYTQLITTPHIKSDIFPNTTATIQQALDTLKAALIENDIHIPIRAAAEYYIDDIFMDLLEKEPLLTLSGKELLVEFSFMFEPVRLPEIIFRIETKGYKPVLAHPERYPFYHQKYPVFADFKNRGCLLQLNTLSLTGYYGKPVKDIAERLLHDGLYDYCGTDIHHDRHLINLQKMLSTKVYTQLMNYPFQNKNLVL